MGRLAGTRMSHDRTSGGASPSPSSPCAVHQVGTGAGRRPAREIPLLAHEEGEGVPCQVMAPGGAGSPSGLKGPQSLETQRR